MTGQATTSSSFHYQWTYNVFINFRGEDTRHGFTGNLYHALKKAGISTFIDDKELQKGDEITPTLLKAIKNSRMAITVFSKNYASSTFCLNELLKIHQCIKGKNRKVWPIFYDVEPSEVRHQKGNYEQALTMHKINGKADDKKIQRWKLALQEVANISGSHVNPRHGYEYQIIEGIVKEISSKINRVPFYVAKNPIGLDSRMLKLNSLLEIGSNEVNMVGIYGIGGMGKTTIARAVYNSVADTFESLCFLHDVKEGSKLGLNQMQESMLSNILGVDIKVEDVNEGVEIIKMRLKQKKILLILDNVDKHEQLEKLAGDCNWFGAGSRIIITTRDKHLLVRHGVERKYEMEAFNAKESHELLSRNVFRNNQVNESYMEVLNHAINYANGLPLALEVIGSNLCGKSMKEWESMLDVYKKIPNEDIQQTLKVSYDGLEQVQKEIFLDIACFYRGKSLKYVKFMVEQVHGFNPNYGIRVLKDKCLIKIGTGSIEMHDLIQNMGREIVRQESPKEPGKRSRLWFHQDIIHVLEENTGANEVHTIIQDNLSKFIEVNWDGEAFRSMKNLKILIFKNMNFSEGPKYLPNSLKVLKWSKYPSTCLPPHFCSKKLLVFKLRGGCLNSLETIKKLENLSVLNLMFCQHITQIPDLSSLQHLKQLEVSRCENLIEIHDSVGYLAKLEILDVSYCAKLNIFPCYIKLPSLEVLDFDYCSSLKYFPEILEEMKIEDLHLIRTGIEKMPWSICNLTQLTSFNIENLWELMIELPKSIFLLPKLRDISVESCGKWLSSNPKEAQEQAIWPMQCPNQVDINLPKCNISDELLRTYLSRFINVETLDLRGNNFTTLPAWIKDCQFLQYLYLNECKHLREVEGMPPNIKRLEAANCISLSLESISLLLSEEFHGAVRRHDSPNLSFKDETYFIVPTTSIPEWFDHSCKGPIIFFWYQYYFPPLCLCALFKPKEDIRQKPFVFIIVSINNEVVHERTLRVAFDVVDLDINHLVVYNLSDRLDDKKMKRARQQWNHVSICVDGDDDYIKESGIYVVKELYMMGDIQFTDPYQRLDFISGDQATFNDLEENNTSVPLLPWTEHASGTFNNQGHTIEDKDWLSMIPCWEAPQYDGSSSHQEEEGTNQFGVSMKEKEPMLHKKRTLMEGDNFASCSNAFRNTKRGRNCSINQDDNDTNTIEIQDANVTETTGNQVPLASHAEEYERENNNNSKQVSSSFLIIDVGNRASHSGYTNDNIGNQVNDINDKYKWLAWYPSPEATFTDLNMNNTLLPMLPWTEHARNTFSNQGHSNEDNKWLSLRPCWETPFYEASTSQQEFQQRQNVTSINVEQIPESFEDNRKAKGKEIVVYNDNIYEE